MLQSILTESKDEIFEDFKIDDLDSSIVKNEKFIKSVEYLAKNDAISLKDEKTLNALNYLNKCKVNINDITSDVQSLFAEIFEKLIKNESSLLLVGTLIPLDASLDLNLLIKCLQIIDNNSSSDNEDFVKKLKEKSELFEVLFKLLSKITEDKHTSSDSSPHSDVEKILFLILNLVEKTSPWFQNYKNEWESYNTMEILIKTSNKFRETKIRNKVLNIIKNIYDYEENNETTIECNFKVNSNDSSEDRSKKRKIAIDFILNFSDFNELKRNKYGYYAIRYLSFNVKFDNEKFETIHDGEKKSNFVKFLVSFCDSTFNSVSEEIKQMDTINLDIYTQAKTIKSLSYIGYLFNFLIIKSSSKSYEFNVLFINEMNGIEMIFRILNSMEIHDIFAKFKPNLFYYAYLRVILTALEVLKFMVKFFFYEFKQKFHKFDCKSWFQLDMAFNKIFASDIGRSISILPHLTNFSDDNEEDTKKFILNMFSSRDFEKAAKLFFDINNADELFNSRKAIIMLELFFPSKSNLEKLDAELKKKFIKLSVQFVKFSHVNLVNDLKLFNAHNVDYQVVIDKIVKVSLYSNMLFTTILNVSDKSLAFCLQFHEESEDSIEAILNLLIDKLIQQQLLAHHNNYVINFVTRNNYKTLVSSLHNLSKAAYKYKERWTTNNTFSNLLNLGNKMNSLDNHYQIVTCMTIANIACENDLNNFSASLSILENLTSLLKQFANILSDESKKKIRTSFQIEEDDEEVEIIGLKGWNLYEILHALYKFSINDNIKGVIYETLKVKDYIKTIANHGNEVEQEFAFKLLNQLCFDKKILTDVFSDATFYEFMKVKISTKTEKARKNLIKYIESILWLINEDNKTQEKHFDVNLNSKHIFLSYNSESRAVCLSIKSALESLGYKIWIDVENIHGSSIDAMAKEIESSFCVLICMTERYKESTNCRFEAEYVIQLKKPFIPLILQKSYKPDGW